MRRPLRLATLGAVLAIGGCATVPANGPSVMVLPGTHSNFNQFRSDDYECQGYARQAIGISPAQAAADSAVNSAAAGAAVGAAAGALIGAATGDPAGGAAVGAGAGLLVGSAGGADAYGASAEIMQDRYDVAYVQCMYAKGHQVPVPAGMRTAATGPSVNAPPPPGPPAVLPPPPPRR
ncbi:MAG: hypothetical protein HYR49_02220 [Gammaproteobacteria bacterium]|nr:hypothetical protein [Gammaproteobacteria bacterium]